MSHTHGGQRQTCRSQFSSVGWVLGIKLKLSSLVASAFIHTHTHTHKRFKICNNVSVLMEVRESNALELGLHIYSSKPPNVGAEN